MSGSAALVVGKYGDTNDFVSKDVLVAVLLNGGVVFVTNCRSVVKAGAIDSIDVEVFCFDSGVVGDGRAGFIPGDAIVVEEIIEAFVEEYGAVDVE